MTEYHLRMVSAPTVAVDCAPATTALFGCLELSGWPSHHHYSHDYGRPMKHQLTRSISRHFAAILMPSDW